MKSNSPKISFNTGAHDGNPAPDAEAVPRRPDFWLPSYQNPDLPHLTRRGM